MGTVAIIEQIQARVSFLIFWKKSFFRSRKARKLGNLHMFLRLRELIDTKRVSLQIAANCKRVVIKKQIVSNSGDPRFQHAFDLSPLIYCPETRNNRIKTCSSTDILFLLSILSIMLSEFHVDIAWYGYRANKPFSSLPTCWCISDYYSMAVNVKEPFLPLFARARACALRGYHPNPILSNLYITRGRAEKVSGTNSSSAPLKKIKSSKVMIEDRSGRVFNPIVFTDKLRGRWVLKGASSYVFFIYSYLGKASVVLFSGFRISGYTKTNIRSSCQAESVLQPQIVSTLCLKRWKKRMKGACWYRKSVWTNGRIVSVRYREMVKNGRNSPKSSMTDKNKKLKLSAD